MNKEVSALLFGLVAEKKGHLQVWKMIKLKIREAIKCHLEMNDRDT